MLEQALKDLLYSARGLVRDRSFSVTSVATLTVALTLVTVGFAVFNAYVLRPYAVRDPYSLYEIRWSARQGDAGSAGRTFRWADYQEIQRRKDLFEEVIGERNRLVWSESRPLQIGFVTGNYFQALGGRVLAGRSLVEFDAGLTGADPVAVLSYSAWVRLFDRDSAVVGRTIRLNDRVALGATPAAITRLIMRQAARLVAIGSGAGLLLSFSALGVLAAIVPLENVSILNPGGFILGTAIIALATAIAAFFPSRAATRIDPAYSLRADQ
jgi:hypothetical protein